MAPGFWTHASLDALRLRGDPLADSVIARLYTEGRVDAVNLLMRGLVANGDAPSSQLPPYVLDYLARTSEDLPAIDAERLHQAQALFDLFGPEILTVLGFYSLPASYAARRGVQVLDRTGYLRKAPVRRLFETAQMVVDVMSSGGLEPGGRGVRTAQKVRLMHAAVRHLILQDTTRPWDITELGVPINQEDMAGTLMTFSYVVLEGLKALDVTLSLQQQEAWLHAWGAVGHVLGLDARLIPVTLDEARELTYLIRERQIAVSPEGVVMTHSLVEGLKELVPGPLQGLPASFIHFFLDQDQWRGINVADLLQVPRPDWTAVIPEGLRRVGGLVGWMGDRTPLAARLLRFISRDFVAALVRAGNGGPRAAFTLPEDLQSKWRLAPERRATLPEALRGFGNVLAAAREVLTPRVLSRKVA
ncbi:DUF2236 domain-containing protein [Pyxidicoccus parkwayensis]|uniref:DUF2236 domain-containing protein n=1 Tax=Pyxidicoccus parkwayensis TaxID=2813578 RepID=A0ABX7NYQ3_9BACT|nr:oxygenase MpaB family protein [Pyxidicoccus parkwaysis]QSQ24062.1 DUF2236 domain-containing protein [Pyxidicoccus parkwaysis]